MRKHKTVWLLGIVCFVCLGFYSCVIQPPADDFITLAVEGMIIQSDVAKKREQAALQTVQQVLVGTMLAEVTQDSTEQLAIDVLNLNVFSQDETEEELNIVLAPDMDSNGVITKGDAMDQTFGTSYVNLYLGIISASDDITLQETSLTTFAADGTTLLLGGFQATTDINDSNRLTILGDIPLISYLFKGRPRQAKITELVILLTPDILQDDEPEM